MEDSVLLPTRLPAMTKLLATLLRRPSLLVRCTLSTAFSVPEVRQPTSAALSIAPLTFTSFSQ